MIVIVAPAILLSISMGLLIRMKYQRDEAICQRLFETQIADNLRDEREALWTQIHQLQSLCYATPKTKTETPQSTQSSLPVSELILSNAEVARQRLLAAVPKAGPMANTLITVIGDLDAIIVSCEEAQVEKDMLVSEKIAQVARAWNGQMIHLGAENLGRTVTV